MDELYDTLVRVGAVLLTATLAIVWLVVVLTVVLPELGHLAAAFVATPGGLVITALSWRALAPRRRRAR